MPLNHLQAYLPHRNSPALLLLKVLSFISGDLMSASFTDKTVALHFEDNQISVLENHHRLSSKLYLYFSLLLKTCYHGGDSDSITVGRLRMYHL